VDLNLDFESFGRFTRTYRPGEIIFSEFEPGNAFYLIRSGRVHLLKNEGEHERTLDILEPPEIFGEMAILENAPRSATAIAVDQVEVLELNAQNFELLIHGNPQIAIKLLRIFSKRIYDSKRRIMILTKPDSQSRIADVFLMLDETQTNIDKSSQDREFHTTVEDIAHWAGMGITETREVLSHFAEQHRLEMFPDRIVIKNINGFARLINARRNQN
jgi:CRP-like cAMP-binding protein